MINKSNEIENEMNNMMNDIEKSMRRIKTGDLVKGEVISVNDKEVLVNIGYITDGIIAKKDFSLCDDINLVDLVKAGDTLEVVILKVNDGEGNVVLSKNKADEINIWKQLQKDFKQKNTLNIKPTEVVKGGLITYVKGIRAFIPASHLAMHHVENLNEFLNKEIQVRIIEFDKNKNKIVLSRKEIEKEILNEKKENVWSSLEKGEKRQGTVRKLMKFGAFVDLGGIDGLIHLTDLSWKRVNKPSDIVKVGDKVEVYVLDFDKEKNRISLALKDINQDPWEKIAKEIKINEIIEGKVMKLVDFGAFVQIGEGVEGLVHLNEISEDKVLKPSDLLKVGDKVKVKVINIDLKNKRIALSIKEAKNSAAMKDLEKYNDQEENVTLGDLFAAKLKDLKLD